MLQKSILKRFAPPSSAITHAENYLADKASTRTITPIDSAIGVGLLANFMLSFINVMTHVGSVAGVDIILSLYLFSLLLWQPVRPLMGKLLLAGFVAGICELFTDASGQSVAHSLIYPSGEPSLWASPLYMPLSWMVILTLLGYVSWRLRALLGLPKAALISGIVGAIQIPIYEEMAYYGGWWQYRRTHLMLGHTPIYVLLFEGLIVAALPLLYDRIERRAWSHVVLIGVLLGAWMPFAALFSWLLLGL